MILNSCIDTNDLHCNTAAGAVLPNLTIEWRAFEGPIGLLDDHDIYCSSHMRCEAVHSAQDGCATHDHPAL